METNDRVIATFASKGHDLWACLHGRIRINQDTTLIDRLWSPLVSAWFEGGKEDPNLLLLQLTLDSAKVWQSQSSVLAGIKSKLLGQDPKQSKSVAEIRF